MKIGDIVYVPKLNVYGFIKELKGRRIVSINHIDINKGTVDVIQVIDLIVEAVGYIKQLIIKLKILFGKHNAL